MACERGRSLLIAAMGNKTKRALIWGIVSLWLFLPGHLLSGSVEDPTGIVKGTVTIGGRATSDALVSVEGLSDDRIKAQLLKLKTKRFVMDQREVKFIPRVLAVPVGSTVDFLNSDRTFHNVFSTSEAKKFDLGLYSPGRSRSVTFDNPGVVKILCHVHPHMEAFIVVKEHPSFGFTDGRGNYQLENVPLGKFRLEIWHPEFGSRVESFTLVRDGEVLSIDVDLKGK